MELYMEGHTVLISYFSPHPKREKKQCRKCPVTSSEQEAHHVLALPLMASSNKFSHARVKIPPCSKHALFFNLLPGGSYISSLSSKCLPCLCLQLVSSPSICNKLMVCSIHLYITSQLFACHLFSFIKFALWKKATSFKLCYNLFSQIAMYMEPESLYP